MHFSKFSPPVLTAVSLFGLSAMASAALLTEDFATYPNGGTGWTSGWVESAGTSLATGTLSTAAPLNGGGQYLSVTTTANSATTGILRSLDAVANLPYTLSFDYRLDTPISDFSDYNDRIHFGTSSVVEYGTNTNWKWIIGVVGADNPAGNGTSFEDGVWYFYNNSSTASNGGFTLANMTLTGIALTTGVTYSFIVDVNPASQTYDASISGSDASFFSASNLNFRNQTSAGMTGTSLVFGNSNSYSTTPPVTGDAVTFSLDNISVVPEPCSVALIAVGGLLCSIRRRRR